MSKFTLKSIDCELGVSVEINKVWYRLSSWTFVQFVYVLSFLQKAKFLVTEK